MQSVNMSNSLQFKRKKEKENAEPPFQELWELGVCVGAESSEYQRATLTEDSKQQKW